MFWIIYALLLIYAKCFDGPNPMTINVRRMTFCNDCEIYLARGNFIFCDGDEIYISSGNIKLPRVKYIPQFPQPPAVNWINWAWFARWQNGQTVLNAVKACLSRQISRLTIVPAACYIQSTHRACSFTMSNEPTWFVLHRSAERQTF